MSSLDVQYGGSHYKNRGIQPVEFWADRKWDAFSGSILKYLTRWRDKGGVVDLEKALHFAELRMELKAGFVVPNVWACKYTMSAYVKANNIIITEDPIFYSLEAWVQSGNESNEPDNRYYLAFIKMLAQYIEEVKGRDNGEG